MRMMLSWLGAALFVFGFTTLRAWAQPQSTWRDETARCTWTLPPNWTVAPQALVDETNQEVLRITTDKERAPRYAAGALPTTPDGRYALVQLVELPGDPNYDDIEQVIGVGLKAVEQDSKQLFGEVIKDIKIGQGALDRSRNRITLRGELTGPDGVPLQCVSFGHLSRGRVILIHCYAPTELFDASLADFEGLSDGLKLDAGAEFVPGKGIGSGTKVFPGAIGGVVGAITAVLIARSQKKKKQQAAA